MILLAASALLILSYRSMLSANIGFANRDAAWMNLQLRGPGLFGAQAFDPAFRHSFYTQLLDRLRAAPGVTSAAAILLRPLEGPSAGTCRMSLTLKPAAEDNRVSPKRTMRLPTPEYFKTVGTPLLEGRDFNQHDAENDEPVVTVSQSLAQRIRASGRSPLGSRLRLGLAPSGWRKIVGIRANARYQGITQKGSDIFVPYLQAAQPTNYVVIRGTQSAADLAALVRTCWPRWTPLRPSPAWPPSAS